MAGRMMGMMGVVLALAAGPTNGQDQAADRSPLEIERRTIVVDGNPKDWVGIDTIEMQPDGDGVETVGTIEGAVDLTVILRTAWDADHLYLLIEWRDDVIDAKRIARDEAMWRDDEGNRLDRMYFHDGLSLLLVREDFFYRVWLTPLPGAGVDDEKGALQWDRLRPDWRRFDRERPDVFPDAAETVVSTSTDAEGQTTGLIEAKIPWEKLQRTPKAGEDFELMLAAPDADDRSLNDELRAEHMAYLAWQGTIEFVELINRITP